MEQLLATSLRFAKEAKYARINFAEFLRPRVYSAFNEFKQLAVKTGVEAPFISSLRDDAKSGTLKNKDMDQFWGDSIRVSFGNRPFNFRPRFLQQSGQEVPVEAGATLVFSQAVNGMVFAVLYPPISPAFRQKKRAYVVEVWANPLKVRPRQIHKLLDLLAHTQFLATGAIATNRKSTFLSAKLQTKDLVLLNGGSRLWVGVKFSAKFILAVLRLYRIGTPLPP